MSLLIKAARYGLYTVAAVGGALVVSAAVYGVYGFGCQRGWWGAPNPDEIRRKVAVLQDEFRAIQSADGSRRHGLLDRVRAIAKLVDGLIADQDAHLQQVERLHAKAMAEKRSIESQMEVERGIRRARALRAIAVRAVHPEMDEDAAARQPAPEGVDALPIEAEMPPLRERTQQVIERCQAQLRVLQIRRREALQLQSRLQARIQELTNYNEGLTDVDASHVLAAIHRTLHRLQNLVGGDVE